MIKLPGCLLPMLLTWLPMACAHAPSARDGEGAAADLARLRTATAPFQQLDSAVAAGYPRVVKDCLIHEHHGAMGFHHVNAKLLDRALDLEHPEILLYERISAAEYRLNGVEFIVPFRLWPADSVPPRIMGQQLSREDKLAIWYLHVWAWKQNPNGLFANFHPDVQCPSSASKVFRPSGA